ncbi:MAG: VOC family protein [Actinomycetota bacterium]|nr:VOC family protein [Actinomycetota bacterium]
MSERIVIDHVTVVVTDLTASQRFYDAALASLGFQRVLHFPGATGYGSVDRKPDFWIITGEPATTGVHVAFVAASRELVDDFHAAALAAGGTPRHEPKEWPIYHAGYYGAFVDDPDGNNIEAVHHG